MTHLASAVLVAFALLPGPTGDEPAARPGTVADAVTLRDGKVVLGEVVEPAPRGQSLMHVRRAWARDNVSDWAKRWEAAEAPATRRASAQRLGRLKSWQRERGNPGPDDRISAWLGREVERLDAKDGGAETPLMLLKLSRGEVKGVVKAPKGSAPLLRLAWVSNLRDPEGRKPADVQGALEGRGFDADGRAPVSLDRLLPPRNETDAAWLTRRAATEVTFDPGLRFARSGSLVFPEPAAGQAPDAAFPGGAALSVLKDLLGDNQGDPLAARLAEVAARGKVGAVVTNLNVAPDLSTVSVEMTLWVRSSQDRWLPAGARRAVVRPGDLGPEPGKDLGDDPTVRGAFQLVESLGLGAVPPEARQKSLAIGAATRKALGEARSAAEADLSALALPVLDARAPEKPSPAPAPAPAPEPAGEKPGGPKSD